MCRETNGKVKSGGGGGGCLDDDSAAHSSCPREYQVHRLDGIVRRTPRRLLVIGGRAPQGALHQLQRVPLAVPSVRAQIRSLLRSRQINGRVPGGTRRSGERRRHFCGFAPRVLLLLLLSAKGLPQQTAPRSLFGVRVRVAGALQVHKPQW